MTIIHIYPPTEETNEQVKDEFNELRLQALVDNRNLHDMLIITGDTNTKVGDQNVDFERVMGSMDWEYGIITESIYVRCVT